MKLCFRHTFRLNTDYFQFHTHVPNGLMSCSTMVSPVPFINHIRHFPKLSVSESSLSNRHSAAVRYCPYSIPTPAFPLPGGNQEPKLGQAENNVVPSVSGAFRLLSDGRARGEKATKRRQPSIFRSAELMAKSEWSILFLFVKVQLAQNCSVHLPIDAEAQWRTNR